MVTIFKSLVSIRILSLVLTALVMTWSVIVNAGQISATSGPYKTPMVELYTSEGCSSCPPADEWISKLGDAITEEFHAVPLAFHVDYWNRLGWPDPYSDPKFTYRQRELAANNQQRSIYTPEFLVSGREARGTTAVVRDIQSANEQLAKVMITFGVMPTTKNNQIAAELLVDGAEAGDELFLAVFENNIDRKIEGGENRGRNLHHDFVVRHWVKAATLRQGDYQATHELNLGKDWNRSELGLAAIVISPKSGDTLQALSASLSPVFE